MSLDDKRLAAAFFLPGTGQEPAPGLLARIGATDIATGVAAGIATGVAAGIATEAADPSGLVDCRWAGMAAKGYAERRLGLTLLCVFFFRSAFLEQPDGGDAVVEAFGRACEAVSPIVAVVATHLHQADIDALWALAPAVLEKDVDRLAGARFGLLFVSYALGETPTAGPDRDRTWLGTGELVFAGNGPARWF